MYKNLEGLGILCLWNKYPHKFTISQRRRFILYGRQAGNAWKFIVMQFHLLKKRCLIPTTPLSNSVNRVRILILNLKTSVKIKRIRNKKVNAFMRTEVEKKIYGCQCRKIKNCHFRWSAMTPEKIILQSKIINDYSLRL